ncbi:MAG TPA: hypothetical protein PKK94_21375 [Leptospiraceae bacterium]|nr:hypothetical protein [Leptospiraceae bacterium]
MKRLFIYSLLPVWMSLADCSMRSDFINTVKQDFKDNNHMSADILTEKDISHLPEAVRKYLRHTKSVGQPKVKNFRAEFTGGMRGNPGDDYMKLESVQYNFYNNPSRYFYMIAKKMALPAFGLHMYKQGSATFQVRLLNLFTVVDAKGEKMNQAETVTLFNDMCFIAPPTLIDRRIKWEKINDRSVKGIYTNGKISISAVLHFNEKGELVNFLSNDRFHTDGVKYESYPWETPVETYKEFNGYLLPSRAKLVYKRSDGDFTYGELEYKSVKYNLNQMENE